MDLLFLTLIAAFVAAIAGLVFGCEALRAKQ